MAVVGGVGIGIFENGGRPRGVIVIAFVAEMSIEAAIVSANWR